MSQLQVQLAELRTLLAGVAEDVKEIKADLKVHVVEDEKVHRDVALLQDRQKQRSKFFWAATTAWIGLGAAWIWDRIAPR